MKQLEQQKKVYKNLPATSLGFYHTIKGLNSAVFRVGRYLSSFLSIQDLKYFPIHSMMNIGVAGSGNMFSALLDSVPPGLQPEETAKSS